jgi:hypothetical protein
MERGFPVKIRFLLLFSVMLYTSCPYLFPMVRVNPAEASFYPAGYASQGSTRYISGPLSDLQSDDEVHTTFRSHVSAQASATKTDAFISNRDTTTSTNTPKERTWTGDSAAWGGQSAMPDSGSPVRRVRTAYCPMMAIWTRTSGMGLHGIPRVEATSTLTRHCARR